MMHFVFGDTMYFAANDASTGVGLWAHNTSNNSTWQVIDLWTGGSNGNIHSSHPGWTLDVLVGDTLCFGSPGWKHHRRRLHSNLVGARHFQSLYVANKRRFRKRIWGLYVHVCPRWRCFLLLKRWQPIVGARYLKSFHMASVRRPQRYSWEIQGTPRR